MGRYRVRPRARPLRAARGDLHQPPGAHALAASVKPSRRATGPASTPPSTPSPTTTAKGRWPVTPRRRSTSPGGPRPRRRPSSPSRRRSVTSTAPSACWSCSTDLPSSCDVTCCSTWPRPSATPGTRGGGRPSSPPRRWPGPSAIPSASLGPPSILAPFGMTTEVGFVGEEVLALYEEALAGLPDEPSPVRARLLSAIAVELQWGGDDRSSEASSRPRPWRWPGPSGTGPPSTSSWPRPGPPSTGATASRRGGSSIQQEALAAAEREHDPEASFDALTSSIGTLAAARRGGRGPVPPRGGRAPSPTGSACPAFAGASSTCGPCSPPSPATSTGPSATRWRPSRSVSPQT